MCSRSRAGAVPDTCSPASTPSPRLGPQLWDTAFAVQALAAAGPSVVAKHADTLARAYAYVDASQAKEDVPQRTRFFRTISKGGWPFSTNGEGAAC